MLSLLAQTPMIGGLKRRPRKGVRNSPMCVVLVFSDWQYVQRPTSSSDAQMFHAQNAVVVGEGF